MVSKNEVGREEKGKQGPASYSRGDLLQSRPILGESTDCVIRGQLEDSTGTLTGQKKVEDKPFFIN